MNIDKLKEFLDRKWPEKNTEEQLENLAEKQPSVAIQNKDIIPNVAKEAEQTVDNDKRNDEANNNAIKKDIGNFKPTGMLKPKANVNFDEFAASSPSAQKQRIKFNRANYLEPELTKALDEFSDDIDKEHQRQEAERAADNYMDEEEQGEIAEFLDKNLPVPEEPEEEQEEPAETTTDNSTPLPLPIPLSISNKSEHLNNISAPHSDVETDNAEAENNRQPGYSILGKLKSIDNASSGNVTAATTTAENNTKVVTDTNGTSTAGGGQPIPSEAESDGTIVKGGSNNTTPSSNGTVSSGAGLIASKHTVYSAPKSTAPVVPNLGLDSTIGMDFDPHDVILQAVIAKIEKSDPNKLSELSINRTGKGWTFNDIPVESLSSEELNQLMKQLN